MLRITGEKLNINIIRKETSIHILFSLHVLQWQQTITLFRIKFTFGISLFPLNYHISNRHLVVSKIILYIQPLFLLQNCQIKINTKETDTWLSSVAHEWGGRDACSPDPKDLGKRYWWRQTPCGWHWWYLNEPLGNRVQRGVSAQGQPSSFRMASKLAAKYFCFNSKCCCFSQDVPEYFFKGRESWPCLLAWFQHKQLHFYHLTNPCGSGWNSVTCCFLPWAVAERSCELLKRCHSSPPETAA